MELVPSVGLRGVADICNSSHLNHELLQQERERAAEEKEQLQHELFEASMDTRLSLVDAHGTREHLRDSWSHMTGASSDG